MRPICRLHAFTLIELLVVVAIIAILAAIALPNFLEAQARAKVSRAMSDLRVLATALESYRVDLNRYPPCSGVGLYNAAPWYSNPVSQRLIPLTTPVAYITAIPKDPFPAQSVPTGGGWNVSDYNTYDYVEAHNARGWGSGISSGGEWRLVSPGPDLLQAWGGQTASLPQANPLGVDYDPTNGTLSTGDLVRVGALAPCYGGAPDDLSNPYRPAILRVPSYREQY
jgi:type II secretion system protein G